MVSLFLYFYFCKLFLHLELCKPLFLNPINIIVKVFRNDNISKIRNKICINPYHLDQISVAGAEHINDLNAERLHVKGFGDGADIEKHLKSILFNKLLSEY